MAALPQLQVVVCGLSCFWVSACVVARICWCIRDADDEMCGSTRVHILLGTLHDEHQEGSGTCTLQSSAPQQNPTLLCP